MRSPADTQLPEVIWLDRFDTDRMPAAYGDHYFTHLLCHAGSGQFLMAGQPYHIAADDLVIWLPAANVTRLLFSPDFKASVLLLSFDLLSKNNPDIGWGIKGYLFSQQQPVIALSEPNRRICLTHFQALHERNEHTQHRFHQEVLNAQVQLFVLDMWNIFAHAMEQRRHLQERGALFERFLQLVQEHCMEHREVEFYSEKLCITAKYLTEICKKNSGKTAMEWIRNYTTQRLLLLLNNKHLTLTEIADTLHFSSASFFSRYVRRELGMSPTEYRQRL
ncbi:AraC-type DNA-binding protein, partial [Catalinimonas alkaloidigena]